MAHEIAERDVVDREDRCCKLGSRLLRSLCILPPSLAVFEGIDLDPDRVFVPCIRMDIPVSILTGSANIPDLVRHKGSLVGFPPIDRYIEVPAISVVIEIRIVGVVDVKVMDRQILVAILWCGTSTDLLLQGRSGSFQGSRK